MLQKHSCSCRGISQLFLTNPNISLAACAEKFATTVVASSEELDASKRQRRTQLRSVNRSRCVLLNHSRLVRGTFRKNLNPKAEESGWTGVGRF